MPDFGPPYADLALGFVLQHPFGESRVIYASFSAILTSLLILSSRRFAPSTDGLLSRPGGLSTAEPSQDDPASALWPILLSAHPAEDTFSSELRKHGFDGSIYDKGPSRDIRPSVPRRRHRVCPKKLSSTPIASRHRSRSSRKTTSSSSSLRTANTLARSETFTSAAFDALCRASRPLLLIWSRSRTPFLAFPTALTTYRRFSNSSNRRSRRSARSSRGETKRKLLFGAVDHSPYEPSVRSPPRECRPGRTPCP